jgi:hypothetical protein
MTLLEAADLVRHAKWGLDIVLGQLFHGQRVAAVSTLRACQDQLHSALLHLNARPGFTPSVVSTSEGFSVFLAPGVADAYVIEIGMECDHTPTDRGMLGAAVFTCGCLAFTLNRQAWQGVRCRIHDAW